MSDLMRQVLVVVWPGLGVGAGAELPRVATYVGKLEAPTLAWLGLGNVAAIRGVAPASPPAASHGKTTGAALELLIGDAARAVLAAGRQVHLVGAAGAALKVPGATNHAQAAQTALEKAADLVQSSLSGLVIAMPTEDELPVSASPVTSARAVQRLDGELARLFDRLQGREDVLVLLTSDAESGSTGANGSATLPPPSHRWVPVLAHLGALPSGVALGDRQPSDLGATAAEALGASATSGTSFLAELLA